jgi:hypothetical protein
MGSLRAAGLVTILVLSLALLACGSTEEPVTGPAPQETQPGGQQPASTPETVSDIPLYPGSVQDSEKCGGGAYYVDGKEPSVTVKEYCEMLREQGWALVGEEACPSGTAGGVYFRKGGRTLLVTYVGYDKVNTCYYPRYVE